MRNRKIDQRSQIASTGLLTAALLVAFGFTGQAQTNTFPPTGSVGIGTTPTAKLDVVAAAGTTVLRGSGPNAYMLIGNVGSGESYYQDSTSHRFQGAGGLETMTILGSGKVGIGTTNPMAALDVQGLIQISALNYPTPPPDINYGLFPYSGVGLGLYSGATNANQGIGIWTNPEGVKTEVMRILSGGNIGIGTITPAEKLSVNGKIRAREIKVEVSGWPDDVFESDYPLASLESTEKQIKDYGHLAGIPSKAQAESSGIDLGEMNKKLLQKVEELTLYLISQHKTINQQSADLARQDVRIQKLEAAGNKTQKSK